MDQREGQVAGGWRICGLHSEKESIFQIYANGSKNREKWLGKSDNRAIYLRGDPLDAPDTTAERRMIVTIKCLLQKVAEQITGKQCKLCKYNRGLWCDHPSAEINAKCRNCILPCGFELKGE